MGARNPDRSDRRSASPLRSKINDAIGGHSPSREGEPARAGPKLVSDNSGHEQQLSRVVELEIIPRLLLMHAQAAAELRRGGVTITSTHVATLAELAVENDPQSASRFVHALADAGATPRQVLLELLGPCAALMGSWWCSDVFDFADVSIGICRLQQALHDHVYMARPALRQGAPRILLAAPPESQHTFGAAIAAECFVHAGWDAQFAPGLDWESLGGLLEDEKFDVLGVSLSCDAHVVQVASGIVELRRMSRNPRLGVMVGGPLASARDDLATRCNADGMATGAADAVEWAQRWVGETVRNTDSMGGN